MKKRTIVTKTLLEHFEVFTSINFYLFQIGFL